MNRTFIVLTEFACAALNIWVGIAHFGYASMGETVASLIVGGMCFGFGLAVLSRGG